MGLLKILFVLFLVSLYVNHHVAEHHMQIHNGEDTFMDIGRVVVLLIFKYGVYHGIPPLILLIGIFRFATYYPTFPSLLGTFLILFVSFIFGFMYILTEETGIFVRMTIEEILMSQKFNYSIATSLIFSIICSLLITFFFRIVAPARAIERSVVDDGRRKKTRDPKLDVVEEQKTKVETPSLVVTPTTTTQK